MLRKLSVSNYALIEKLDIRFEPGFSIITGETGSGKSILLGALALILGQRADTSVLQDKSRKCIIEGEFDITKYGLTDFFDDHELDYEDISLVRREINESGKSRAFINDTPVNLNVLKELGTRLVDIHSQHHNLVLAGSRFQLEVIDVVAGNIAILENYKNSYNSYIQTLEFYNSLQEKSAKATADLDYFNFQLEQLDAARLKAGEKEELEEEQRLLNHSGEIKEALNRAAVGLDGEENSILGTLRDIAGGLARVETFFPKINDLHKRLQSSSIELKDISDELGRLEAVTEFDPDRVGQVSERLDMIYGLQQKHHVGTVEELITLRDELRERVEEINNYEFSIAEAGKKLHESRRELEVVAVELSGSRVAAITALEEYMSGLLRRLGIPNARFKIRHTRLEDFTPYGNDRIEFLFSANRQSPPMELGKVASGGEMSRVMLSLKSLIAKTKSLPTIIFDEIDSGVSGEVAGMVGNIMKEMSLNMQVVNITHLPQIAGKGDQQYLVFKEDVADATHTRIRLLSSEERIREIARMLSSDGLTEAAMVNAKELLEK